MKNLNITTKRWIWNTWEHYTPEWFVTILWNDLPTSPITSSSHTKHLRNKILCEVSGARRCGDLPEFPDRLGITAFQERTEMQKGQVTFHTHLHLYNCTSLWESSEQLHCLIRYKIGNRIEKLLKSTRKGNEGVVVRRWEEEHHRYYNLKEMERQKKKVLTRYTQDNDLLLDFENSDLLPMESQSHGYKRLSSATDQSLRSAVKSKRPEITHI